MASKSWPRTNVFQYRSSAAQLGRHHHPIKAVGDRTSDGCKNTFKRKREESEKSLKRDRKRIRTNPSSAPVYTDSVEMAETVPLPSKRRCFSAEPEDRPAKRARRTLSPVIVTEASPGVTSPRHSKAAFEAKYEVGHLLGQGGFATVFAGRRRNDNLPVAIKLISQPTSELIQIEQEGKSFMIPSEVAVLLKLQPTAEETSAVVALLDWYNLDEVLILVLERPDPCMDLLDYITSRSAAVSESEAKTLIRQLVDAIIEIHSKGVFHNDVKLQNILIETGSAVPRVRIIDFGFGKLLSDDYYDSPQGTFEYASPEYFLFGSYKAESATVWQLGITLFALLHRGLPFKTQSDIISEDPNYDLTLSRDCQDFLMICLCKIPEYRPTLESLKRHSWLVDTTHSQ